MADAQSAPSQTAEERAKELLTALSVHGRRFVIRDVDVVDVTDALEAIERETDQRWQREIHPHLVDATSTALRLKTLEVALRLAKAVIRTWHDIDAQRNCGKRLTQAEHDEIWALYQHSPEMRQINAALEPLKP